MFVQWSTDLTILITRAVVKLDSDAFKIFFTPKSLDRCPRIKAQKVLIRNVINLIPVWVKPNKKLRLFFSTRL